jgi:hypothetical protein
MPRESMARNRSLWGTGRHTCWDAVLADYRYALYPSNVLLASPQIEPITGQVPDQIPLGKAQLLDREAYESLLYH